MICVLAFVLVLTYGVLYIIYYYYILYCIIIHIISYTLLFFCSIYLLFPSFPDLSSSSLPLLIPIPLFYLLLSSSVFLLPNSLSLSPNLLSYSSHSKYTCRHLHILIYIPDSSFQYYTLPSSVPFPIPLPLPILCSISSLIIPIFLLLSQYPINNSRV